MGVSQESIPEFNEYNNDFLKTKQGEEQANNSGAVDNKSLEVDKKSVESKKSNLKVPEQKGAKQTVAKRNSQKLAASPKNAKGKPSPTAKGQNQKQQEAPKGRNAQKGKNKSTADDGMVKARDDE